MPLKPEEIMAESFRIIEAEVGRHPFAPSEWPVVRRLIHASGDLELIHSVRFHNDPVRAAVGALTRQTPIVTDVTMVLAGIHQPWAQRLAIPLHCFLNGPDVAERARKAGTTRSAIGMEQAITLLPGAIYVIGNAPTALLALCAATRAGRVLPSLIVAMPVGFVAVAESKEEALRLPVPVITITGRKGGSAGAAAVVNALLQLALVEMEP